MILGPIDELSNPLISSAIATAIIPLREASDA